MPIVDRNRDECHVKNLTTQTVFGLLLVTTRLLEDTNTNRVSPLGLVFELPQQV